MINCNINHSQMNFTICILITKRLRRHQPPESLVSQMSFNKKRYEYK